MRRRSEHQPLTIDDGIIDVTGNSVNLKKLLKYEKGIPYWRRRYMHSHSEIYEATPEQQQFYKEFKHRFLKDQFLDVEGNYNYLYILLFDLYDNDYRVHKDISLLEKQCDDLSFHYPKIYRYARSLLRKKLQDRGDHHRTKRVLAKSSHDNTGIPAGVYDRPQNYRGQGTKYRRRLGLRDEQVRILNRIHFSKNNFLRVKSCKLEVIKLFLRYISALTKEYSAKGTTIDQAFEGLADFVAAKEYKHVRNSSFANFTKESIINEVYTSIFRHTENTVREVYSHKRKLKVECIYTNPQARSRFESVVVDPFHNIKPLLLGSIKKPDTATEIKLNAQNTSRWKQQLDVIEKKHLRDAPAFFNEVNKLAELNQKNPAIGNIFLEASKSIAKFDKEASLKLYMHYLDHDLKSTVIENRQPTKTINKRLLKSNDQHREFEKIVNRFLHVKDLQQAFDQIPNIYAIQRKRIRLDKRLVQEVQQQHTGTVELLTEYLNDECQEDDSVISEKGNYKRKVTIPIQSRIETEDAGVGFNKINLTDIQKSVLDLFVKSGSFVPRLEIEAFAKEKNMFKDQLIESINESCFEALDDILIAEVEEYYEINQDYYKQLLR